MTFATLRALHAVIGAAIDEMERTYQQRSPQLDFPSLDEPYYPRAQHTPEEELAETLKADPVVAAASKRIVAACGQLSTTVNKPWFGLMEDVQAASLYLCPAVTQCNDAIVGSGSVLGVYPLHRDGEHRRDPARGGSCGPARRRHPQDCAKPPPEVGVSSTRVTAHVFEARRVPKQRCPGRPS